MRVYLLFLLGVAVVLFALNNQNTQKQNVLTTPIVFDNPQQLLANALPATLYIESDQNPSADNPTGSSSLGAAFFISVDGYALTAYHVVELTDNLTVINSRHQHFKAKVIGFDAKSDLALLKVNTPSTAYLSLADQAPHFGDSVMVLGNSEGGFLQEKYGKIIDFDVQAQNPIFPPNTFETTAPLAPGDSGGPIISNTGQILGVVSYIRTYQDNTRTSYGVPIWNNSELLQKLRGGFKRAVPVIGIRMDKNLKGVVVDYVFPYTPAAEAGIKNPSKKIIQGVTYTIYDTITALDGTPTQTPEDFKGLIRQKDVGDVITLTINRDGKILNLPIQLESQDTVFNGE